MHHSSQLIDKDNLPERMALIVKNTKFVGTTTVAS